jgi:hypothetical protein
MSKLIIGDKPAQLGQIEAADAMMIGGKIVTKADYLALAAQVEALKDLAKFWINQAKPLHPTKQEYDAWIALGYESKALKSTPVACLSEVRADAARTDYFQGYLEGFDAGIQPNAAFAPSFMANQYAERIRLGGAE